MRKSLFLALAVVVTATVAAPAFAGGPTIELAQRRGGAGPGRGPAGPAGPADGVGPASIDDNGGANAYPDAGRPGPRPHGTPQGSQNPNQFGQPGSQPSNQFGVQVPDRQEPADSSSGYVN